MARALVLLATAVLAGCGGPPAAARSAPAPASFEGVVTYEARSPTPQGASSAIESRPARWVDVALIDANGATIAEGRTDERGAFLLRGTSEARAIRVFARTRIRGHDAAIARDALGRTTHSFDVALGGRSLAIRAEDRTGDAGALHVLDAMVRGLDAVAEWTSITLPPVYAYWVRGGTREWSYYRGEQPAGSGRFALELLGGDPGQQSTTDTDEHDEAIILHELGHFVMDRLSGDSSTGGSHPRGVRIDPGLAWEEGRATWFALAVLRETRYRDTIGIEPWGTLRLDEDAEAGEDPVAGLGSESSVLRVLWDLADGTEALADADGDGIALGPAAVLGAMIAHSREPGVYPSLTSFVHHLAARGDRAAIAAMLQRTGQPAELLPRTDPEWPAPLAVDGSRTGKIDGMTQPAPSGGPNFPQNGYDAIHTFRVRVDEPGLLGVHLVIRGSGRTEDHQDLDLELRDLRADTLAEARGTERTESVARFVQPGWYIVRVRDGGSGNRADYEVRAELETLGGPSPPARP